MCTPEQFKKDELLREIYLEHDFDYNKSNLNINNNNKKNNNFKNLFIEEIFSSTFSNYQVNFPIQIKHNRHHNQLHKVLSASSPLYKTNDKIKHLHCLPDRLPENVIGEIGNLPLDMPCSASIFKKFSFFFVIIFLMLNFL